MMMTSTPCDRGNGVEAPAESQCRVRPVCHCLGIHADEIRQVIADEDLTNVRQVTKSCGAGGGCTACHRHIKRYLAEATAERATDAIPVLGFA